MFHFVPTWERQTTQITTGKAIYIDPGGFGTAHMKLLDYASTSNR